MRLNTSRAVAGSGGIPLLSSAASIVAPKPNPCFSRPVHDNCAPGRTNLFVLARSCCVPFAAAEQKGKEKKCPSSRPTAGLGTTPVPRHRPSVKSVSNQVRTLPSARRGLWSIDQTRHRQATLHTSAKTPARTSRAPRAPRSSRIRKSQRQGQTGTPRRP